MTTRIRLLVLTVIGLALACDGGGSSELSVQRTEPIAGGETSDFGNADQSICGIDDVRALGRDALEELGFDVEADIALFSGVMSVPFKWASAHDASSEDGGAADARLADTRVELDVSLDSTFLVERRPNDPDDPVTICPDVPQYRVHVRIETLDGKLSGTFFARLDRSGFAVTETRAPPLLAYALPDLRNFTGTLALPIDLARTHWSVLDTRLVFSEQGASGYIEPLVVYADGSEPPRVRAVPHGAWAADEDFSSLPWAVGPDGDGVVLDDYQGSREPARFAASVRVNGLEPKAPVDVRVEVGGEARNHMAVAPGTLELGTFVAGTEISAEVENTHGAGFARAEILVDDCFQGYAQCEGAGCVARASYTIWPSRCAE